MGVGGRPRGRAFPIRRGHSGVTSAPLELRIRAAGPESLDAVVELLSAAARWWQATDPPSPWPVPFPIERVRPAIERGEMIVVHVPGRAAPIGCLSLQWEDPEFWGEQPPVAGYVHRFAVDRDYAGRRVGEQLLAEVERRVLEVGRDRVRLDTRAASRRLVRYYEDSGFLPVGHATVRGIDCVLLERTIVPKM